MSSTLTLAPRSIFSSGWNERAVQNSPLPTRTIPLPPASISSVTTALLPVIPRCLEVPFPTPEREPVQEGGTQDGHAENRGRDEPYGLHRDAEPKQGGREPHDGAEREEEQEERDGQKLTDEGKGRQHSPENDLPDSKSRASYVSLHHRRKRGTDLTLTHRPTIRPWPSDRTG